MVNSYNGIQITAAFLQTDKIIKDIQSQLNNIQGLSVKISKSALESGFQQNVQTALNQMTPVALKIDTTSIVLQIQKALKEANISVPTSSVSAVNSATSSRSNKSSAPSTQRVVRSEADGTVPMDKERTQSYKDLREVIKDIWSYQEKIQKADSNGTAVKGLKAQLKVLKEQRQELEKLIEAKGWYDEALKQDVTKWDNQGSRKYNVTLGNKADSNSRKLQSAELKEQRDLYQKLTTANNELYSAEKRRLSAVDNGQEIQSIKETIEYWQKEKESIEAVIKARGLVDQVQDAKLSKAQKEQGLKLNEMQGRAADKVTNQKTTISDTAGERLATKAQNAKEKIGNLDYDTQIKKLETEFAKINAQGEETQKTIQRIRTAYQNMTNAVSNEDIVASEKKFNNELKRGQNLLTQAKLEANQYVSTFRQVKLENKIRTWLKNNTAATKDAKDAMQEYLAEVRGNKLTVSRFNEIDAGIDSVTTRMREMGKLGNSFVNTIQAGAKKFFEWTVGSTAVMKAIHAVTTSLSELKEIDTTLTEISKTSDLTSSQLRQLGSDSFDVASKYGKKANDYLLGQQEMYRAGFTNADGMAELSTLAQAAGDMTADLANDYLIASNAAFEYNGNVEKLNALLDGQNQITNRNAVSMEELANATKTAGSLLANVSNLSEQEMSALLGTGIATSRESGETVARALRSIMMNLQGVAGEGGFEGEEIDAEQLKKVEARCHSLGVELEYMKDGMASLRDPIEVLRDLSEVYNSLPEDSAERAGMIADIGGKYRANVLSSILSHFDQFDKMMADFENSQGSAYEEAMKSANNWE